MSELCPVSPVNLCRLRLNVCAIGERVKFPRRRTSQIHTKDPRPLLTANTYNVIVAIADLYQAGNKLVLSDVSLQKSDSVFDSGGKQTAHRHDDGEILKNPNFLFPFARD